MLRRRFVLAVTTIAIASAARAEPRSLQAADGVGVYADLARATRARRGTILLFHQAGTNRGEYEPIAPRLNAVGFDTLAIDQRSGGRAFGQVNETVQHLGHEMGYTAALPDLEAALAWAQADNPAGPVIVWGSSYSAALVFVLAARHAGGIQAVLSFSPGEYLSGIAVRGEAAKTICPVFVTSASDPGEEAAAAAILNAVANPVKRQFKAKTGLHGSSTLRPENRGGAEPIWQAVAGFLDAVAPPGKAG